MQPFRTVVAHRAAIVLLGVSLVGLSAASFAAPKRSVPTSHKTRSSKPAMNANAQLMRRFYAEVFNTGNMDATNKFIAANYVEHSPFPGQPATLDGLKKGFLQYRAAFPDLRFTVNDVIVQGDKAVARWTATGTHKGVFMGIAPSGKKVQMHGVDIVRIVNGKAVEHWGYSDDANLMQQISPPTTDPATNRTELPFGKPA